MKLLRALILRPLRRDLLRTALTVLSVTLGVAVVVAIDLASDAATGSFRSSIATLVGNTDLEVLANGGIDERWLGKLAALPYDARFSPAIETQAVVEGIGSVTLYGVDLIGAARADTPVSKQSMPAGDPDRAIVVSRAIASRLGLEPGHLLPLSLNGRRLGFEVTAIAEAKDAEFLVLDIAAAQQALGRFGSLDRIDITVNAGEDFTAVERAVRASLPPGYLLEKPGARSEENQRMLRAFRWNLRVLSYISLVVGAFLIYNTISVSVVRRRAEIGVLRALGAGRHGVLRLFLAESLLFGLAGAALGVVFGRLLAAGTVGMISSTVNSLYTTSRPAAVVLTWREAATGIFTGLAVALAAAFAPAREAMNVVPTEAIGRGAHEHHARMHWRRDLAWAAVLSLAAGVCSLMRPVDSRPVGGYAAALLAVAAAALAAPAVVLGVDRSTRPVVRRFLGVEGMMAGRGLAGSLSRTSVMVGALGTAIAMMASVGIMVGSFRETVQLWLDQQLRADLYIRTAGPTGAGQFPPLPQDVAAIAASVPGVEAVDLFRGMELRYGGQRATLGAGRIEIIRRYGRFRFLPGEDRDAVLRSLPGQDRAIVSEPFANRHGLRAGGRISIPIGGRTAGLTIAGIYYDYSSSQGYVVLDESTLLRYLPGQPATNAALYLRRDADPRAVRIETEKRLAGRGVSVAANLDLRRGAMVIFDRTFAITWALEAVAIVVAMLGAANSLLALVLDRRRELGLLRYLGASVHQVRRMILLEAGFLGLLANVLGLALGFALSLLLIYVVNKQSFGWTIQFHSPRGLLAGALLLVWCATVLAGLYPARVASRLDPIDVIHEE
jgi:putative ABC transport system permease protein